MKTRLEQLLEEHERAKRAFKQDPTVRVGSALKRVEAAIKYERSKKK